jgi:predicted P-loop ATPase
MAKLYRDLDSAPDDYDAGKLVTAREIHCATFESFVESIAAIRSDECVIRGGVREDARPFVEAGERVRRLAYDREECAAAFEAVDRNWIVLDADETSIPFDVDDPEAALRDWDVTLPERIRNAPRAFFPSASAHRSPTLRGKLVVALARPMSNADAEAWAKANGFDGSVCRTVQPNYFAAPIFEGCEDPLREWRAPTVLDLDGKPARLRAPKADAKKKVATALAKRDEDAAPLTERARKLAKKIGARWLAGGRVEGNAWLHLCGWCLSKGWSKGELSGLLAALDTDEPDPRKRAEHVHILHNAREIEGPGGAREWLGDDFDKVDRHLGHNAQLEAYARDRAARRADATDDDFAPAGEALDLILDTDKQGRPLGTHANVARVLEHAFATRIRYEAHAGRIVCADVPPEWGHFPAGQWTDVHTTAMVIQLNTMRVNASATTVSEAVVHHSRLSEYNVLTDWLLQAAAQWDGVPRVDACMAMYWRADDTPATRAVGRVFLLSLAARGLEPGCKVDTALVMIGEQGIRKSSSLRALAGQAWFSDSPLAIGSLDGMQILRGKWLWELAEYASVSTRDRNVVKQFLSSSSDVYRASYGRFAEEVPRQTCFAISTNDAEILNDPTGARRFLPVTIARQIDTDAIERDRVQLLGEAAKRVLEGEQWHPTAAEDAALAPARLAATELSVRHDPWEEPIEAWLDERRAPVVGGLFASPGDAAKWLADPPQGAPPPFTLTELTDASTGAVPLPPDRFDKRAQMRLSAVLRGLGFDRTRERNSDGGRRYVWVLRP